MYRFLVVIALLSAGVGLARAPTQRAAAVPAAALADPPHQPAGKVLDLLGDVSGSATTTDPAGMLNSLLPAAAYAATASRTYVTTFADAVGPARQVEAADERSLLRVVQDALGHASLKTTSIYRSLALELMDEQLQRNAL